MSHKRMLKAEAQLEEEIAALLRKAELIDAQEDQRYGKSKRGDELPKELRRRQDRIQVLRKAKAELEAEAAADHACERERKARCLASSPLAVWRQTSWPVRVVAGLAVVACDNVGPAIGKLALRGSKAFGVTGFL
jgi:hypothetical protein